MMCFKLNNSVLLFLISILYVNITIAQVNKVFDLSKKYHGLTERWELDPVSTKGTFLITSYKPIYILPARWSSHPGGYSVNEYFEYDPVASDNIEAKFQISFKVKTFQGLFWGHGDLWIAYTQQANWQVYNKALSSPFRETDYEPEAILNFATDFNVFGLRNKMLGISLTHRSNGRGGVVSRSWNRLILQVGLEKNNWSIYIRPWFRFKDAVDENPHIVDYVGRGETIVIYNYKENVFSFTGSHNLRLNSRSRGMVQFEWAYPISGNLKAHLQFLHGYGETLIDYDNKQTTFGIGISLIEWL